MPLAKIKIIATGFSKKGTNKIQKILAKTKIKTIANMRKKNIEKESWLFCRKPERTPLYKNI